MRRTMRSCHRSTGIEVEAVLRNRRPQCFRLRPSRMLKFLSSPGLLAQGRPIDQEIIQPSACLNLRPDPPGLLAAAGPGLHWVCRISILLRNGRVRAARAISARYVVSPSKLTQPLLEPGFFRLYFSSELKGHFFMELPQFSYRHRIQVIASHDTLRCFFRSRALVFGGGQSSSSIAC